MDRDEVCASLITWMRTFGISGPCQSTDDLSDGVAMAQVLHQIAPSFFNEAWMSKIKTDDVTNWRLKVSNLKKVLKGILEYNLEVIGIQIHDFQMPDVNSIGEHSNIPELGRLLQLILGCAVNCDAKQEYIQRIMSMEESVQHVVMNAIQELMTKEITTSSDGESELADQLRRTTEELSGAMEAREELTQRCHELDQQVAALIEEKQGLVFENDRLNERLNLAENLDDPATPAGKRFQQLQQQVDKLQEENFKLDSSRDDLKIKSELLARDFSEIKQKNVELMAIADEARSLKDEVDVLRHTSEQVSKYESSIESYKKKLDELSDLRGQVKLLEEKNTKYMTEHLELEEELRKASSLKQQLEGYKRQVHELQNKLTEETKRADKADFEAKRAQDKMSTLQREKERMAEERDSLRELNEEMKLTQLQNMEDPGQIATSPRLEMLSLPPEVKEKLLRLEHENKMLKLRTSEDNSEQAPMLQSMLDDANARKNELETELRIANQRIMALEAQVEDIQESQTTTSNEEMLEMRKKLNEQIKRTQDTENVVKKNKETIGDLEARLSSSVDKVQELQDQLNKKDDDMKLMEARYKKYLEKAKSVFKAIDTKQNTGTVSEVTVTALKNQLQEKERHIEQLEKENDKAKNIREQEEKYIVSAWYNLGMQLNRQATEERLANASTGQSFLARQRQVHSRRTQSIPNSHPNSTR
ncbi:protein Hook homolog 3-like isoform X2 [Mizuhopecten yessoensis]|uniref:protein Hook homolog 3-like isoform X2 n=1 Tax=Mizuhopecten yessoensis TaxID=6573 RepID=UPI000B45CE5A|nr:protein Hook homolog 3-like isoform X2 [Mizuhopecten yessoensis]